MTALSRIVNFVDRAGLRRTLAPLASFAYPNQQFMVDRKGRWLNRQSECTIVSTTINTKRYSDLRSSVLGDWCRGYIPQYGDVVLDIGSGVGEEALIFSGLVGESGRIIAVEAYPSTFDCLTQTVTQSGLTNVEPQGVAIADVDGEIVISSTENHLANSIVNGGDGVRVKALAIDNLCKQLKIQKVDFLRMNIEGAERLAVLGMNEIAPYVQNLCISCHDFVADGNGDESMRTKKDVEKTLVKLGFKVTHRTDWSTDAVWQRDYLDASRAHA